MQSSVILAASNITVFTAPGARGRSKVWAMFNDGNGVRSTFGPWASGAGQAGNSKVDFQNTRSAKNPGSIWSKQQEKLNDGYSPIGDYNIYRDTKTGRFFGVLASVDGNQPQQPVQPASKAAKTKPVAIAPVNVPAMLDFRA